MFQDSKLHEIGAWLVFSIVVVIAFAAISLGLSVALGKTDVPPSVAVGSVASTIGFAILLAGGFVLHRRRAASIATIILFVVCLVNVVFDINPTPTATRAFLLIAPSVFLLISILQLRNEYVKPEGDDKN